MRSPCLLSALFVLSLTSSAIAKAPPPAKTPVVFGTWKGRGAGTFKSGVHSIVAKGTQITTKKNARALIEGEVEPKDKGVVCRVIIKGAQNGEVVETREFPSPKPSPSKGLLNKIGRAIVDMVQRVPVDQPAP